MLFTFYAFVIEIIFDDIIPKKFYFMLDDISGIYEILMFIAYFLIAAAVIEFFKRRKSAPPAVKTCNQPDDETDSRPLYKKIFSFLISFLDSVLFWFGLLFEAVFVFLSTLLSILVYFVW